MAAKSSSRNSIFGRAAQVLSGTGIHTQNFTHPYKQRHSHYSAGTQGRRLSAALGRVAFKTGVGFGHFQFHMIGRGDRKSTRLNSSHVAISYAVFCLKKKKKTKFDGSEMEGPW